MITHHSSQVLACSRLLLTLPFLIILLFPVRALAADDLQNPAPAQESSRETGSTAGTIRADDARPLPAAGNKGYGSLDLSYINFEARNAAGPEAAAYGLIGVAGYRLSNYLSIEGAVNWLPLADPAVFFPIPLMWTPAEKGFYVNLAGGMRLNLAAYDSHRVIPWVSLWYTGHYVISDYSVNGSGLTYGAGLEWKTEKGKRRQLSLRIHEFDGDLEVKESIGNIDYGRTDIRAVEVAVTIYGG